MQKRRGDKNFIEQCFSMYEHKMYYVAYAVLHDVQLSEDAVQEAFIRLIRSGKVFDNPDSEECKRYLYAIIKNVSLNVYRKRKREAQIMYPAGDEIMDLRQDEVNTDDVNVEELLECLPEKYADVVKALVIENRPVSETAVRLDISEANVRKRFERAKKMIKNRRGNDEKRNTTYREKHS